VTFENHEQFVIWIAEQIAEDEELRYQVANTIATAFGVTYPLTIDPVQLDDALRKSLEIVLDFWAVSIDNV
jgi:hypothetical protein